MSPPKLSEVEGVDMPGEAFMRTVFGLKKGEIGVAMNQPQTVAYVVKVIEFAPPPRLLMDLFETTSPERYLDVARPDSPRNVPRAAEGVSCGGRSEMGTPSQGGYHRGGLLLRSRNPTKTTDRTHCRMAPSRTLLVLAAGLGRATAAPSRSSPSGPTASSSSTTRSTTPSAPASARSSS